MLKMYPDPTVAVLLAVSVSKLVPLVGFVLQDADTPLGSPDAPARLTLPANPFSGVTVMVSVTACPWVNVKAAGETPRVKVGVDAAVTVC
jgi:hypothetical protein